MNLKHLLTNLNPFKKKEAQPQPELVEEAKVIEEPVEKPERLMGGKSFAKGVKIQSRKFEESEKAMMVTWYALGYTRSEIVERAKEELNIDVSESMITFYARAEKWQPLIRKVRQDNMNDIAAVAGSHKRIRLERHEKVFEKALKKGDLKNAVNATEHQRKEMEGGGDTMVNLTMNQFNVLNDDELEFKKKEVMERIKLISSRQEKKNE